MATMQHTNSVQAELYESTGKRLLVLGVGALIFLTLVTIGAFYVAIRLIMHLPGLSAETAALVCFATLAGIAAVVRSIPSVLRSVAEILNAHRLVAPHDPTPPQEPSSIEFTDTKDLEAATPN